MAGFVEPTPIQRASLPASLHGRRDVVGAAETGSGKTLAFGLPILQRLLEELDDAARAGVQRSKEPFALIIAPTRELAHQVASHLHAVAPPIVGIASIVGGMSIDKQRRLLGRHPEIIVGTPGRLWELASDGQTTYLKTLHQIRFFVLDEVDRMVEAGHFRELRNLLALLERGAVEAESASAGREAEEAEMVEKKKKSLVGAPGGSDVEGARTRQTFLFSATLMLPPKAKEMNAKRLAKHKPTKTDSTMDSVMRMLVFYNPLKVIDLSRKELVASGLEQAQLSCTKDEKDAFLFLLLRTRLSHGRSIVFTNAVTALSRLRSLLSLLLGGAMPVLALQGSMQQRARLKALDRFKALPSAVLLATDVAARGLDISGVEHVVHYQLPRSAEVYVHRSGRTARAAASGLSVALVDPSDVKAHRRLCNELGMPEGLAQLPIDAKLLPKVREVVSIAKQLDKQEHAQSKKSQATKMRRKLAEEMDLPSDSDEDDGVDDSEVGRRHARREMANKERLKEQLKRLLGRIERPSGVPTHVAASSGASWS